MTSEILISEEKFRQIEIEMLPRKMPKCFAWLVMFSLVIILLILSQTQTSTSASIQNAIETVKKSIQSKVLETKLNIHRKLPLLPDKSDIFTDFCNASMAFKARPYKPDLPILYIVTPTYTRREQVVEMVRMSHTLLHGLFHLHASPFSVSINSSNSVFFLHNFGNCLAKIISFFV